MDKNQYDEPEDKSETQARAVMLLVGALAIAIIAWAVFTGNTPIGG